MFQKIYDYLFNRRAIQYLASTTRESRFLTYDKVNTVLILFESDFSERNPVVRQIINTLKQDGKKVFAWGYIDKKDVASAIFPDFRILNNKDTDFFRRPHESHLNELSNYEFDMMIDLTLKPLIPLQYFAMQARVVFKVGIHKSPLNIYDFVLDVESLMTPPETEDPEQPFESPVNETYVFDQIIFYLKSIQSKD